VRGISTRLAIVAVLVVAGLAGLGCIAGERGGAGNDSARLTATVARVVDGDTVILSGLGRSRLIGVDTPEVHGRRECFGTQASAFAKRMLLGRRIRYAAGVQGRDRYGRALVYVWLPDGRFFNELLITAGYARPLAIAPNVRHAQRLRRLARAAARAARGMWSPQACR